MSDYCQGYFKKKDFKSYRLFICLIIKKITFYYLDLTKYFNHLTDVFIFVLNHAKFS